MTKKIPSESELNKSYDNIANIHKKHLKKHGVKLPLKTSYKWVWLAMLYYYINEPVHKDQISDAVRLIFSEAGHDQQVRHLKRDGWYIEGERGYHKLIDIYNPSPEYKNEQVRRRGRLNARNFDAIKKSFNFCCATCGSVEGQQNPRYGRDIVQLQQGHKDPDLPSNNIDNIIPQCQFCNRAYRRDFTFDDKGRTRAVADIGPVQRANQEVKKKIWKYLNDLFEEQ